jgi:2-polyprenyl-3-methyl-5-hydroxy-6-metoxy-1,4-benzoquinol methylase
MQPATERMQTILAMLKGPRVLHVGCCGTRFPETATERAQWLHAVLVDRGSSVHGGDINQESLRKMRDAGYSVEYMDAQAIDPAGEKFDTIVAGELIEHLENPGLFLRGCHARLAAGGQLILSTPNAFSPLNFLGYARKYDRWANPEHTCWFDPQTITELLRRSGFETKEIRFVDNLLADESARFTPLRLYRAIWSRLRPVIPARFRNGMVIHAVAAG